jgi:hypothetical protein
VHLQMLMARHLMHPQLRSGNDCPERTHSDKWYQRGSSRAGHLAEPATCPGPHALPWHPAGGRQDGRAVTAAARSAVSLPGSTSAAPVRQGRRGQSRRSAPGKLREDPGAVRHVIDLLAN